MNIFIVQGRAEMLAGLYEDELYKSEDFTPCWTCPSQIRKGDMMLIYLMKPISGIVGKADFSSEPFMMNDTDSEWFGWRMASYENLRMLPESDFIALSNLKILFPNWAWTTRPQGAVKVPDIYQADLLELLNFNNKKSQSSLFE